MAGVASTDASKPGGTGSSSLLVAILFNASAEGDRDTIAEPGREIMEFNLPADGPNIRVISLSADTIESDP